MKQFYIYVHCRPSGEPFYVGKGSGRRAYDLRPSSRVNPHHANVVTKYGKKNILISVYNCESEQQSFQYEVWFKKWCDSQNFKLTNLTNGGEGGTSGYKHTEQTKIKMRKRQNALGHTFNPTAEFRAAISIRMKDKKYALGYHHTLEAKTKISEKSKTFWNTKEGKVMARQRAILSWTDKRRTETSVRMKAYWLNKRTLKTK